MGSEIYDYLESAFSDGAEYSAAFTPKMLQLPLMDAASTQNKINLNSLLISPPTETAA